MKAVRSFTLIALALLLLSSTADGEGPTRLVAQTGVLRANASPPILPADEIRFVAVDEGGNTWIRHREAQGLADHVMRIDPEGRTTAYENLRAAVESNFEQLWAEGSLLDFWAVDPSRQVWVGPAFYNGIDWTEVARNESWQGGSLEFEDRVAFDREGKAWVPYHTHSNCMGLVACDGAGLAAFDRGGRLVVDLDLEVVAELADLGLPTVRFEKSPDGQLAALTGRAFYLLPFTEAHEYRGMEINPVTGVRTPGFAASAAWSIDGKFTAFTWIEPLRQDPQARLEEASWGGSRWRTKELDASPLFDDAPHGRFISASAFDGTGGLWLASSDGEMAIRQSDRWVAHFSAANSPLGAPIRDLAVDGPASAWVATADGLRRYADGQWADVARIYLPAAYRLFDAPPSGRIAFQSHRFGQEDVFSMRSDGSDLVRHTTDASEDGQATWSPDGQSMVFMSLRTGNADLFRLDLTDGRIRQLTQDPAYEGEPSWSPLGDRIVYHADRDVNGSERGEIYTVSADGGASVNLTQSPEWEYGPFWSPDASRIAFVRDDGSTSQVHLMRADGVYEGCVTCRLGLQHAAQPVFSPDGFRLAFQGALPEDGSQNDVWVVSLDGLGLSNVTADMVAINQEPTWSPDGKWIAFESDLDGDFEIYFMRPDGSSKTQLTFNDFHDGNPAWSR